ncbi:MAG TPA: hypothetical protein VFQ77_10890 [Pseudonocardiaceae bacterium]|nr:hypothetical protein [Pseudonocardiaceae bacterium]
MSSSSLRLAGPRRVALVLVEVLVAGALGGLTGWCWRRSTLVTVQDGVDLTRVDGRWWLAATTAATLAGLLLLDALRRRCWPWDGDARGCGARGARGG